MEVKSQPNPKYPNQKMANVINGFLSLILQAIYITETIKINEKKVVGGEKREVEREGSCSRFSHLDRGSNNIQQYEVTIFN